MMWLLSFVWENCLAFWVTVLLSFCGLVYWYMTREYGKFEAKGLYSIPPQFLFGNLKDLYTQKKEFIQFYLDIYDKFGDNKYGIFYEGRQPLLFIKDPELIKQVTVKDFDHFTDLGYADPEVNKIPGNDFGLANLTGQKWKSVKAKISPAFSTKSMKEIGGKISNIGQRLIKKINDEMKEKDSAELVVDDFIAPFAMDVITQVAFGINVSALDNPDNEIMKNGSTLFEIWRFVVTMFVHPKILSLFNFGVLSPEKTKYFVSLSEKILKERANEKKGTYHNDILQQMMKLREVDDNKECLEAADEYGLKNVQDLQLTDNIISKTMLEFFVDGYDSIQSGVLMGLYHIACNPEVLEKAVFEVDDVAEKFGDNLKGEQANSELRYLDQVFNETLRITAAPTSARTCTKDWTIPGTNVTIPKDMRVLFAILGNHLNEKYFPDPHKFDPERFSPENKSKIVSGTYMPFGNGPRSCVGMKLAKMEAKIVMFHILRNFTIEPTTRTKIPYEYDPDKFGRIKGGCYLQFTKRQT